MKGVFIIKTLPKFLVSFIVLFLLVPYIAFADTDAVLEPEEGESVELGETVSTEGEEDIIFSTSGAGGYGVKTLSGPTKVKKRVKYLTGSWAKASSYSWQKANTASSTLSADIGASAKKVSGSLGVSKSRTTSYSITINIPANSKKYSKLGFYSDFDKRYVEVRSYSSMGKQIGSAKKAYHYAPRKDTYLQVVYK